MSIYLFIVIFLTLHNPIDSRQDYQEIAHENVQHRLYKKQKQITTIVRTKTNVYQTEIESRSFVHSKGMF